MPHQATGSGGLCVMHLCCGLWGKGWEAAFGLDSLTSISGRWTVEGSAVSDSWLWRDHSRLETPGGRER